MSEFLVDLMTNEEIATELGRRIKEIRISKNLTQSELASHCGLVRRSVQNLEAGVSSIDSLIRVMSYLGAAQQLLDVLVVPEAQSLKEIKESSAQRQRVRK